jgi:hypothetical protein
MIVAGVAMAVPASIVTALGYQGAAGAVVLAVVVGLIPALRADLRTAIYAAVLLALASGLGAWTSGNAIAAAVIMGTTSLLIGLACRWGRSKTLITVPISVGFIICTTPVLDTNIARSSALLALASLLSALWGAGVGLIMRRRSPAPQLTHEDWQRTLSYALVLAALTGIAAYVSVSTNWGQAGGWFILTVAVVFQPYLRDSLQRMWQRVAGTILGLVLAVLIHAIVSSSALTVLIGIALMLAALYALMETRYPYWVYAALLTPAIVLLLSTPSNFGVTAIERLVATLAGAGLALVAELLLAPLYRVVRSKVAHGTGAVSA